MAHRQAHSFPMHAVPAHVALSGVTTLPGTRRAVLRRLWPAEAHAVRDHLLRLDEDDRYLRFGRSMSDSQIGTYCGQIDWMTDTVFGLFVGGELRGSGILTPIELRMPLGGSASLSVEKPFQKAGHGRRILERLLLAAQNRLYRYVYVLCLSENKGMRALAESFGGETDVFRTETESLFEMSPPTPVSVSAEMLSEGEAIAQSMGLGLAAFTPNWSGAKMPFSLPEPFAFPRLG